jgi:hypothetical protein
MRSFACAPTCGGKMQRCSVLRVLDQLCYRAAVTGLEAERAAEIGPWRTRHPRRQAEIIAQSPLAAIPPILQTMFGSSADRFSAGREHPLRLSDCTGASCYGGSPPDPQRRGRPWFPSSRGLSHYGHSRASATSDLMKPTRRNLAGRLSKKGQVARCPTRKLPTSNATRSSLTPAVKSHPPSVPPAPSGSFRSECAGAGVRGEGVSFCRTKEALVRLARFHP